MKTKLMTRTMPDIRAKLRRLIALLMLLCCLITTSPLSAFAVFPKELKVPPKAMPANGIKKGPKSNPTLIVPKLSFTDNPTDLELIKARVLPEALAPMHVNAVTGENKALGAALVSFKSKGDPDDLSDLTSFVDQYPHSRWRAALELNIGLRRFATGYLSEALTRWTSAWEAAKGETGKPQKAVADEAIAQLVLLKARLGEKDDLDRYLAEINTRKLLGSAEEKVNAAKKGQSCMANKPGLAYKCGPYALNGLLSAKKGRQVHDPAMLKVESTAKGTNLAQLKKWSDDLGLHYQMAKRSKGAPIMVPSVMHWKLGHFATIMKAENGRYRTQDPTFSVSGHMAISEAAVDKETDGYFLVPEGKLPAGWHAVEKSEGEKVWGKGFSGGTGTKCGGQPTVDGGASGDGGSCQSSYGGMAKAAAYSMQATLNINDSPLGYHPPVGPDISFLINYNDLEDGQPASFTFTNFGPDWSFNWLSYLTVDEAGNATIHPAGGGVEYYAYSDGAYSPGLYSATQLTVSDGIYQLQKPDGSIEVFNQTDGSGNVFMTEMFDPQGNEVSISFDDNFRITTITDAIGQQTSLTYGSDTFGDSGFYVVTQITDPFGRSCSFTYDDTYTYLLSITDVLGIVSKFHYTTALSDSSFIDYMTTPYGTTGFYTYSVPELAETGLQFTFPDGTTSIVEQVGLYDSSTYYWDREQMSLYPSDYLDDTNISHCTYIHWCLLGVEGSDQAAVPFYVTPPLEDSISYTYPGGEPEPDDPYGMYFLGDSSQPASITRDAHTWQYEYNSQGNVTQSIDPRYRQFSYTYADNGIDLLEKEQTQTATPDINGIWASYSQHLPGSYTDGSGQITSYTYNDFGQVLTKTDAASNVWTMTYDDDGYLTQIQGPLSGSNDVTTFSYDGYGRIYQTTDSEGYMLTCSYDAADRLTQVTFPDGTTAQTVYDKLDAVLMKDRLGRWTQRSYDSLEQLAYEIDPLGRKTTFKWCDCGSLMSLTDPRGNTTSWQHDIEGRVSQKTYADGSPCTYSYDSAGRLAFRTDALGQRTDYAYNQDNTLAYKEYDYAVNATAIVNYSYDPDYMRLTSVEKDDWGTISYSYNPYITDPAATTTGAGQVSEITNDVIPDSDITYSYDVLGRVTNRSINGASNSSTWAYDPMSRVTSETNPLGEFDYTYVDDAAGYSKGTTRLSSVSYPNGQVSNFNWFGNQGDQRLQGIVNLKSDGTCLSQFAYGYDPAGEITAWQQQLGPFYNHVSKLGYDLAGQLTSAQAGSGGLMGAPYQSQNFYSYDASGNRIGAQQFTTTYLVVFGSTSVGDVVSITVNDAGLSGGQETVSYTVQSGDDLSAVAAGLSAAVNADSNLSNIGVDSNVSGAYIYLFSASVNFTSYTEGNGSTDYVAGVDNRA